MLVGRKADPERNDVGVVEETRGEDKVPDGHTSGLGVDSRDKYRLAGGVKLQSNKDGK